MGNVNDCNVLWGNLGKREEVIALVNFFNQPRNAEAANTEIFDIFMDMNLSKQLTKLINKNDSRDVRPMVAERLSYHIHSPFGDGLGKTLEPDSLDILLAIVAIQKQRSCKNTIHEASIAA